MTDEDREDTVVTPKFGREDTSTAQPVVPLTVVSGEAEVYERNRHPADRWRRGLWSLAVVIAATIIGGVAGGAGFYLYQKRQESIDVGSRAEATAPAAVPEPSATPVPPPESEASIQDEADGNDDEPLTADAEIESSAASGKERAETKIAEARTRRDEGRRETIKHGKKGGQDEAPVYEQRPRRVGNESAEVPREDDSESEDRESRRVGSIVYPRNRRAERRAERRARRQAEVDRVRGIFEGQPN